MHGSLNDLRITWQFYELTMNSQAHYDNSKEREFALDKFYFDHFNMAPTVVRPSSCGFCSTPLVLIAIAVWDL